MRKIYTENTANYPRLDKDTFFADYSNSYEYCGIIRNAFSFVEEHQLLDAALWRRFVEQFRHDADGADAGWRGEYWGKMMRGACFVYSTTKNEAYLPDSFLRQQARFQTIISIIKTQCLLQLLRCFLITVKLCQALTILCMKIRHFWKVLYCQSCQFQPLVNRYTISPTGIML